MARVEALLHEQLVELGEDVAQLQPHEISLHMHCAVHPDGALSYVWKGTPILDVKPERMPDNSLRWRFFTLDPSETCQPTS